MPIATDALLDSPRARQLSDGNPDGTTMGTGPTDLISMFNATPTSQPSGAAQAALARGVAAGSIATLATSQTPIPGIVSQSTTELSITTLVSTTAVWKVAAGDLLYVNKPTAQAALGIGNVRAQANGVFLTYQNYTTIVVTPTAGEKYAIVAVRGLPNITQTLTPVGVGPSAIAEQQFTVTGLRSGELVQVVKPTSQAGLDIVGCRVVAPNTLGITYVNTTTAVTPIVPASESYTIFSLGGLDALNNEILVEANVGTVAGGVVSQGVQEYNLLVTNIATTDSIMGITKPTSQVTMPVGARVSTVANQVAIAFMNASTALVTPTASEVYGMKVFRPNPTAPMVVYSQSLAPVSVAANTSAEQSLTVTGILANSVVWINKPSITPGLGIGGVRVSAANVIAVNYVNSTTAAITPPAETYLIGNLQMLIPDVGNTWVQTGAQSALSNTVLSNAIRSALVALGAMAGA